MDTFYQTKFLLKKYIVLLKEESTILCYLSLTNCKQNIQLTELHMLHNQG